MIVLVTGATGFLGGRVVAELRARGLEVRAPVRSPGRAAELASRGIAAFPADLQAPETLGAALAGAGAVLHCAGGGRFRRPAELYHNNLETTRGLLQAARDHAPALRRFLLVSSLAAQGPSPSERPSHVPPPAPVSHYGRSKALAESCVLASGAPFPVTVLRPPALYGPGDTRLLPLFRAARRGRLPVPASSRLVSFLHVADCARALAELLLVPHPSGRVYAADDGGPHSWDEVAACLGQALGRPVVPWRVPVAVLEVAARAAEWTARARRRPVLFGRDKLQDLRQPYWVGDGRDLRREIGWSPQVSLDEGFRQTAAWYRREGWL